MLFPMVSGPGHDDLDFLKFLFCFPRTNDDKSTICLLKIYPKDRLSHSEGSAEGFCGRFPKGFWKIPGKFSAEGEKD